MKEIAEMCDGGGLTWGDVVAQLPDLLSRLRAAKPQRIRDLTQGCVRDLLRSASTDAGVYCFFRVEDDLPVYVGRSNNLPQRVGENHRSMAENRATVTKYLMWKYELESMRDAREYLCDNYQVRLVPEPNPYVRAAFEVCAAMELGTEFNSFMEH